MNLLNLYKSFNNKNLRYISNENELDRNYTLFELIFHFYNECIPYDIMINFIDKNINFYIAQIHTYRYDDNGISLLHIITNNYFRKIKEYKKYKEMLEFFLKNGADPNISLNYGENLLMYITFFPNNHKIFKMLLNYGADANIQNIYGYTCLMTCCYSLYFYEENIKLLLDYDCDVNIVEYEKDYNALMYFCSIVKNNTKLAKMIKEKTNMHHVNSKDKKIYEFCLDEYDNLYKQF